MTVQLYFLKIIHMSFVSFRKAMVLIWNTPGAYRKSQKRYLISCQTDNEKLRRNDIFESFLRSLIFQSVIIGIKQNLNIAVILGVGLVINSY